MSTTVVEALSRIRILGTYKALGVPTAPGAGAQLILTDPAGNVTTFVIGIGLIDDTNGNVHADFTLPNTPGIWKYEFEPGATVVAAGGDWFTVSPING